MLHVLATLAAAPAQVHVRTGTPVRHLDRSLLPSESGIPERERLLDAYSDACPGVGAIPNRR
ncbi:hypothetical protein EV189_1141 [Motilibacter rhizosphaerae]|uniref:Uncharacterized protein n=1 Tax=Motilibacter rhizosphaerae TaxID=598652 RepID=A0A4Q7NRJ1_9ACTN|nr:hypothetical protein EV189_1141 [Motilibacter rhizosphaerae]